MLFCSFALQEFRDRAHGPPPASKEEVAKLVVVEVTDDVLAHLEDGAECAVCKENLVVGDTMQEMPCKHSFHPDCLKPWLVSSCGFYVLWISLDDSYWQLPHFGEVKSIASLS